jgi:hypothetical protein
VNTFSAFVDAVRINTSLRSLDISQAQIGFRIDDDMSSRLYSMFAENTTLEQIDISGENSRLETTSFGSGFFESLRGLEHNSALQVLRVAYQNLGLQGTAALVEVIRSNTILREIHCSHNKIPLAGLTLLVEALRVNYTLRHLSAMQEGKETALATIQVVMRTMSSHDPSDSTRGAPISPSRSHFGISKPKELLSLGSRLGSHKSPKERDFVPPDIVEAKAIVADKWENQQRILSELLERNRRIAEGEVMIEEVEAEAGANAGAAEEKDGDGELGLRLGVDGAGREDGYSEFVGGVQDALAHVRIEEGDEGDEK